ncbi:hypothetical protein DFH11DRAFT_469530 [Phellopilus nigrolimitatus]|nr:hypothetical protein DFH11DRAFT_469530 [Phellopilus nigrolimitatus]
MEYASTALDIAKEIHALVEKHSKNKKNLLRVSVRLVDDIQRLEDLRKGQVREHLAELDKDITSLQSDLEDLSLECKKIYKQKPGMLGSVKHFVKTRITNVDDIAEQIEEIQKQSDRIYNRFHATNVVAARIEISAIAPLLMAELGPLVQGVQQTLDAHVATSQNDLTQAGALFGADTMTLPQKKEAYHMASQELEAADEKSAEFRIISLKVKAFEAALNTNLSLLRKLKVSLPESHVATAEGAYYCNLKDPVTNRANAVQETYMLLGIFRDESTHMPMTEWLGRANKLVYTLLHSLGLRSEAFRMSTVCMTISQYLANQYPLVFQSELATSLNTSAMSLAAVGKHREALKASQESVDIRRELAKDSPKVFRPDLAMSLNNLSNRLSDVGQHQKALDSIQESVEIYRGLAKDSPEVFRPDLAMSLANLSIQLSDINQHQKALDVIQESLEIYRELAKDSPEVFRPDLAMSLNNLSNQLSGAGQHQKALDVIQESVGIFRELAKDSPEIFRPDLAVSLSSLSSRLYEVGQHQKALYFIQESVGIRRELAKNSPEVFRPDLALSLTNLTIQLSYSGQHQKALDAIQESVGIRRERAKDSPEVFRCALGESLYTYGSNLEKAGQLLKAKECLKESIEILQEYIEVCPGKVKRPFDRAVFLMERLESEGN